MANTRQSLFEKHGPYAIMFAVVSAVCIWGLAHWAAAPGSNVSIFFGLAKYEKGGTDPGSISRDIIDSATDTSLTKSGDADAVAAIRREASELLMRTQSAPGGLWLMAEATTSSREDLLLLADQLKSKYRAEALAHLAYTLAVLDRPEDALHVAERSLAATAELRESVRHYALANLTVTFAEAGLEETALKVAEQAIAEARASGKADGLSRLVRPLVRISSVDHGLNVARGIKDPKTRSEVLFEIVDELIEQGQNEKAGQVSRESFTSSILIPGSVDRAFALAIITRHLSRLGRYGESRFQAMVAKTVAQKIGQNEFMGNATKELITNRMTLFVLPHEELLRRANIYCNPSYVIEVVRSMPKHSPDTKRFLDTAQELALRIGNPVLLVNVSNILRNKGWSDESAELARRAIDVALQSSNPQARDVALRDAIKILALAGDFRTAFAAVDGLENIECSAEVMAELLSRCYAQREIPAEQVSEILSRVSRASGNLEDKDRSVVLMHLAVSQAMLGNFTEAYQFGKQVPLSGYRLAAYSIIVFRYELQHSPDLEEQIRSADEALMVMLAPIFSWSGLD